MFPSRGRKQRVRCSGCCLCAPVGVKLPVPFLLGLSLILSGRGDIICGYKWKCFYCRFIYFWGAEVDVIPLVSLRLQKRDGSWLLMRWFYSIIYFPWITSDWSCNIAAGTAILISISRVLSDFLCFLRSSGHDWKSLGVLLINIDQKDNLPLLYFFSVAVLEGCMFFRCTSFVKWVSFCSLLHFFSFFPLF